MKTRSIKYFFLFCFIFLGGLASAQQRLVLNGGFINITKAANLVIDNPSSNAIVRNRGYIISEGENNILKWNVGTTTGSYTVPWGYGSSNYLPVTFTKSAGTGNGSFVLSTYHTGWKNSDSLPTGVGNVSQTGVDKSAFVVDRFWGIDAQGYTSKPSINNLTLTYLDMEVTEGSNALSEGVLSVQRWNPNINDWGDFTPGVTIDTVTNKITLPSLSGSNFYRWWIIVSSYETLPVEILSFKGQCDNGTRTLYWSTASENNNDHFTLERSPDGMNWATAKIIKGAGNSNRLINYNANDDEAIATENYYRLKQTDHLGKSIYSGIVRVNCGSKEPVTTPTIYPNPSNGLFYIQNAPLGALMQVINPAGHIVYSEIFNSTNPKINLQDADNGIYFLTIRNGKQITNNKLVIQE